MCCCLLCRTYQVIGVEPEDAAGMTLSTKAGQIITLPTVRMPTTLLSSADYGNQQRQVLGLFLLLAGNSPTRRGMTRSRSHCKGDGNVCSVFW